MASQRRVKVFLIAVLAVVFVILYYTVNFPLISVALWRLVVQGNQTDPYSVDVLQGDATRIQNQQFYQSTVEAMDARAAARKSASDDSGLFQKLQPNRAPADAEVVRSNREKSGLESKDDNQDTEEVSIAGRTKMQKPKANKSESENKEAQENAEVEAELNTILKRSPSMLLFLFPVLFYSER